MKEWREVGLKSKFYLVRELVNVVETQDSWGGTIAQLMFKL